jgi:hypothetical protein
MRSSIWNVHRCALVLGLGLALTIFTGCQQNQSTTAPAQSSAVAAPAAPAAALPTVRIKAGSANPITDSAGNVWMADQGFDGGETIDRAPDLKIANTSDPDLYRSEHFSMNSFSYKLPNGKYNVKLHFCETYDGVTGPGDRVFSFNVQGTEFKDFDIWVKAGGNQKAYIQTVPVEITDGKLMITFTPNVENPEINAIEIIPAQ